ncbi:MAG: hypothetical protein HYW88_02515 [Candidatus Sungbacteria bacterium]|nr:hypothetical protein [Candidatus Sungbacteria bacterium]
MEEPFLKKFLKSPFVLIGGGVLFFTISYQVFDVSLRYRILYRETKELQATIAGVKNKNEAVKKDIEYAGSAGFLEREGKARLNLKRGGENVLVILPEKKSTTTQEIKKQSWFERLMVTVFFWE